MCANESWEHGVKTQIPLLGKKIKSLAFKAAMTSSTYHKKDCQLRLSCASKKHFLGALCLLTQGFLDVTCRFVYLQNILHMRRTKFTLKENLRDQTDIHPLEKSSQFTLSIHP
jgi:hypothetical protein